MNTTHIGDRVVIGATVGRSVVGASHAPEKLPVAIYPTSSAASKAVAAEMPGSSGNARKIEIGPRRRCMTS